MTLYDAGWAAGALWALNWVRSPADYARPFDEVKADGWRKREAGHDGAG